MTEEAFQQLKQPENVKPIVIEIRNLGHCPSFKNSKMICGLKQVKPGIWRGKPFLITHPKKKRWMDAAILNIESQLRTMFQTAECATETAWTLPSWIRSSLPLDDSLEWIPERSSKALLTSKGNERTVIELKRL